MSDFNTWWNLEGSGIRPADHEDTEEFAKRITAIAWSNGEFCAQPAQQQDRVRELKCVIADLKTECQALWTQRKPLTDEQLRVIENKINPNMRWRSSDEEGITLYPSEYYELVRAIEAAHGIKEKNT